MKKLFPVLLLLCVLPLVAQTTVSTPEELRAFATQSATSDFEGQTIDLTADIDLAGVTWTPIGTAAKPYSKQKMRKIFFSLLVLLAVVATGAEAQTETLLTTITATAKEQASYSTANVATVSFSYTSGGSSAYLANWSWWGYGWIATVNAAEGYTITKCIFYDDANRTATDSEAPFVVETTEEDKTPRINGTPIDGGIYQSKGIKKIEVYGYATPTTYTLQLHVNDAAMGSLAVTNLLDSDIIDNGDGTYTVPEGAEVTILATPNEGYEFSGWKASNTLCDFTECEFVDVNTVDNPLTFDMNMTVAFMAEFKAVAPTAIENVQSNKAQGTKFFRDDQLLIEKNGKTYNAQGAEVK